MVTDDKPVTIGGIVLSIQQQRTLMWASAFTHRAQENTDINYCFHRRQQENIPRVDNYFENSYVGL